MRCGDCPEGQRHSRQSVYCPLYGIIVSTDHKCELEGAKRHDGGVTDHMQDGDDGAGLQQNGGGAAGEVPGILSGSGEREGFPGMEGREGEEK